MERIPENGSGDLLCERSSVGEESPTGFVLFQFWKNLKECEGRGLCEGECVCLKGEKNEVDVSVKIVCVRFVEDDKNQDSKPLAEVDELVFDWLAGEPAHPPSEIVPLWKCKSFGASEGKSNSMGSILAYAFAQGVRGDLGDLFHLLHEEMKLCSGVWVDEKEYGNSESAMSSLATAGPFVVDRPSKFSLAPPPMAKGFALQEGCHTFRWGFWNYFSMGKSTFPGQVFKL
ncbi:hypothetical protein COLO4_07130 [Corchorus olitorius]|uniref:Uncharacterized protein n=1 Tax=Corchorus olitorius TaxID=93759 RepID=A0A1R3KKW6_9ROSI|nr:hypothetical protein COLO4_07130 [Corchorus olitorius]